MSQHEINVSVECAAPPIHLRKNQNKKNKGPLAVVPKSLLMIILPNRYSRLLCWTVKLGSLLTLFGISWVTNPNRDFSSEIALGDGLENWHVFWFKVAYFSSCWHMPFKICNAYYASLYRPTGTTLTSHVMFLDFSPSLDDAWS